ncbi:hypothetical protein [Flavivirga eckloniae]|uniref:SGNH/GDSL hydrolase family protein n=1 Tax=Flavivirga eckloniae TaxID=1803846 RepID=A0A2K9PQJ8_9FLAO|nr:hypothetical protein [Flavivirga eckloniae]AUP79342.1 hypothetical protein C1H87_11740 [Flavivirga eckloniae]
MNKFIIKSLIFSSITLIIFLWICLKADGYSDPFYIRFTTPKQNSLILGTSRAAQGLQPKVFNATLNENISNYSFTMAHSPFGPTYLNSIKKKVNSHAKNGTFIVTVDPWSLSSFTKTPNDSSSFRELKLELENTPIVNMNPNVVYLLNNWNKNYYNLIWHKKSKMFLHKDGWLEVNISLDSIDILNIENKEKMYRESMLPIAQFSKTRFNYLKQTITFLKKHGEVYLVRLPIHPKIMQIENELMPNFDNDIKEVVSLTRGYLDLTNRNSDFNYTDGNHLHKTSGKIVSEIVASWINKLKTQ